MAEKKVTRTPAEQAAKKTAKPTAAKAPAAKAAKIPAKAASKTAKAPAKAAKPAKKSPKNKALADQLYLFHEGSDCRADELLGAHPAKIGGKDGYIFRTWAPNAKSVSVIGEFNGWLHGAHLMSLIDDGEIWEVFVPGAKQFDAYKFAIERKNGEITDKSDPYAFHAETRPANASKLFDLAGYKWGDAKWMNERAAAGAPYDKPVSIYELQLGSWKKVTDGPDGQFYSYSMIADDLIPYLRETGFTHVEFLPVTEYPLDASWGYQCTGYFAATSRFGTPHDFMQLVDKLHRAGIGVILDWVPAHFPRDGHGLVEFDGTGLYEGEDVHMREHPDWGTRIFDYSRTEVRSFLISSAMFWLEKFHIDGLRLDAVASMLYLDYGRKAGEWTPNKNGGRENLAAVSFLRKLSEVAFAAYPDIMLIAEESTSWPMVTKPTDVGGLGFNFKWNMGWMNDILHYAALDPYFRQFNHKDITFSFMYAFSENFVLPVSHDEVVHGKNSLLSKMPGEYEEKFAGVRAFLTYMFAHPGKKLLFMGQEFGQFIEWNFENGLDWLLLGFEKHLKLKNFVAALNRFYRANSEMWEVDFDWQGFEWICHDDIRANTVSFIRRNRAGEELMFVINFSPVARYSYLLGVKGKGEYAEVFNSDEPDFGGNGLLNDEPVSALAVSQHGCEYSIKLDLPALGGVVIRRKPAKKGRK